MKAYLIRGWLRLLLTLALLCEVALHAHWSITLCLTLFAIESEVIGEVFHRIKVLLKGLK